MNLNKKEKIRFRDEKYSKGFHIGKIVEVYDDKVSVDFDGEIIKVPKREINKRSSDDDIDYTSTYRVKINS